MTQSTLLQAISKARKPVKSIAGPAAFRFFLRRGRGPDQKQHGNRGQEIGPGLGDAG